MKAFTHPLIEGFHRTNDTDPDGALVVAADYVGLTADQRTSRGAFTSRKDGPRGPYYSEDGRWRTRRIGPDDPESADLRWSRERPWILELLW